MRWHGVWNRIVFLIITNPTYFNNDLNETQKLGGLKRKLQLEHMNIHIQ